MNDDKSKECRKIISSQGWPANMVDVLSDEEKEELTELGKAGFSEFLCRRQQRALAGKAEIVE